MLIALGTLEKRATLHWRRADFQLIALLMLMTTFTFVLEVLLLLSNVPFSGSLSTEAFCYGVYGTSFVSYGLVYQTVYVFLLKRASVAQTAMEWSRLHKSKYGRCTMAAWYCAVLGTVTIMPIFVAVFMSSVDPFPAVTGCTIAMNGSFAAPLFAMLATMVLNFTLLTLFTAPLRNAASQVERVNESAARKVRRTVRINFALTAVSVGVQTAYLLLFTVDEFLTDDAANGEPTSPLWRTLWTTYLFQDMDPVVSITCCMIMTNVWQPGFVHRALAKIRSRCCSSDALPSAIGIHTSAALASVLPFKSSPSGVHPTFASG